MVEAGTKIDDGDYKFVREGEKVAYDSMDLSHKEIAIIYRLLADPKASILVDDAGRLSVTGGKVVVRGASGSLDYRDSDLIKPRKGTVEILNRLGFRTTAVFDI
jgi:hypothetical protein